MTSDEWIARNRRGWGELVNRHGFLVEKYGPMLIDRWLAMDEVEGPLDVAGVMLRDGLPHGYWVSCPCGATDHYGWQPLVQEGLSTSPAEFVTCFTFDRQYRVVTPSVTDVIRGEEETYLRNITKWGEKLSKAWGGWLGTGDEFVEFMHGTHGVEPCFTSDYLADGKQLDVVR